MRKISNRDDIFDKLMMDDDLAIYQLFELIRLDEKSMFFTDDKSYISAQSNSNTPIWIFSNDVINLKAICEIKKILGTVIEQNKNIHIIMKKSLADKIDMPINEHMPMNVYVSHSIIDVEEKGRLIMPEAQLCPQIAELIKQMEKDAEDVDITDDDAISYAELNKNSHDLFLWADGGVVAMARIAHKGNKYARINTVVTNREHRGKGYAKMLVGDICKHLLEQGLMPMLYADARNPSSNRTYLKIGFREVGKISEYSIR